MTRFRIGLGMLILLLALGIWAQMQMEAIHIPLSRDMQLASQQLLQGEEVLAAQTIARVTAAWHSYRPFTSAFADHQPLEDIESLLAQLTAYASSGDAPEQAALCAELSRRIQAVADAHRLTLSNLF